MTVNFSLDAPGTYRLEGNVNYDGFVTDAKSLEFEVAGAAPVADESGSVDRNVVAAVAVALLGVLLVTGVVLVRRRRRTARAESRRVGPARTTARQRATPSRSTPASATPPTSAEAPDVEVVAGLGDPWFANLDEGQIDPEVFATALAELDEELGLGSTASRSGSPD
jgi:hypothetical protein